jgi:ribokinase
MKILNFGSLNIDYVYDLDHFVMAGETITSDNLETFCGGKGLNQSIALAHAGADVYHAGKVGNDGQVLTDMLAKCGVKTDFVMRDDGPSGHAIIQVNDEGDNCIILFSGANRKIIKKDIDETLSQFSRGDMLLLQNEINDLRYIIEKAKKQGVLIAFNPAPMDELINDLPLEMIDILVVNEIEGEQISGSDDPEKILDLLIEKYPDMSIVLTLGKDGVKYRDANQSHTLKVSKKIDVVDTTAAGDTFIGYFLTSITKGKDMLTALQYARSASEICITRKGASISIPSAKEVEAHYQSLGSE